MRDGAVTSKKLGTRAEFIARLTTEVQSGRVHLFVNGDDLGSTGIRSTGHTDLLLHLAGRSLHLWLNGRPIISAWRKGTMLSLATFTGHGLTVHRNGGVSIVGVPRSGGTSILWGAVRERVRSLGRKHRARELGPIGVYIGSDF